MATTLKIKHVFKNRRSRIVRNAMFVPFYGPDWYEKHPDSTELYYKLHDKWRGWMARVLKEEPRAFGPKVRCSIAFKCRPHGVKLVADSRQLYCNQRHCCPFCFGRLVALETYNRLLQAIQKLPEDDFTLVGFQIKRVLFVDAGNEITDRHRTYQFQSAHQYIKSARAIEVNRFKPVAAVVGHRISTADPYKMPIWRYGIALIRPQELGAWKLWEKELDLTPPKKRIERERKLFITDEPDISRTRLSWLVGRLFRYPAGVLKTVDVIDSLRYLDITKGLRMMASYGLCRTKAVEQAD